VVHVIDICCCLKGGWTALHYAASHGQCDACLLLLQNGAEVDSKNNVSTLIYVYFFVVKDNNIFYLKWW